MSEINSLFSFFYLSSQSTPDSSASAAAALAAAAAAAAASRITSLAESRATAAASTARPENIPATAPSSGRGVSQGEARQHGLVACVGERHCRPRADGPLADMGLGDGQRQHFDAEAGGTRLTLTLWCNMFK